MPVQGHLRRVILLPMRRVATLAFAQPVLSRVQTLWADTSCRAAGSALDNAVRHKHGPHADDKRGDIRDATLTLHTFKAGHRTVLAVTK
jgi:hypothetical protein